MAEEFMFQKPEEESILYKPEEETTLFKPSPDGETPRTPAGVDYRRTMLPVYVNGYGVQADIRAVAASGYTFHWLYPDGTTETNAYPLRITENQQEIFYIVMDGEGTLENLYLISYGSDGVQPQRVARNCYIDCKDLIYTRLHYQLWAQNLPLYGDLGKLADLVYYSNLEYYRLYLNWTNQVMQCWGSISDWTIPAGKLWTDLLLYSNYRLKGAPAFEEGCIVDSIYVNGCTGWSPADCSQTLVNWDECNADSFARVFTVTTIKRSELTAEGEAAVVSLLAKGCTFTFKAE